MFWFQRSMQLRALGKDQMRGFNRPNERKMRISPQRKIEFHDTQLQAFTIQNNILLLVCGLSCCFWATTLQDFMKIHTSRILLHRDLLTQTRFNALAQRKYALIAQLKGLRRTGDFFSISPSGVPRVTFQTEKLRTVKTRLKNTGQRKERFWGGGKIYEASIN